jgi:dehydrogenase/reductase SDR family protein 4
METNVKNTFLLIQESFELLKVSKNSKILIISSYAAYSPANVIGIYSVSKTALIGLSKVLALELAQFGIRVNCLAPGVIKTKMSETIIDSEFAKDNFMQRTGLPNEISGAAAFLCSDDSSYITGETILIHGGKNTRF